MSRTGDWALRRSASGRAGSPSKSINDQLAVPRAQRLPQMQVAVDPLGRRPGVAGRPARRRRPAARVRRAAAPAPRGRWRPAARSSRRPAVRSALRRAPPWAGRGQRAVHLGGGPAQRVGLGGEVVPGGERAQRQLPAVATRRAGTAGARPASLLRLLSPRTRRPARAPGVQPARPARRGSSRSGLTPGWMRRNTFRMNASPYTSEELDCSASSGRGGEPGRDRRGRVPVEAQRAEPNPGAAAAPGAVAAEPGVVQRLVHRQARERALARHGRSARGARRGGRAARTPSSSW